MRRLLRDALALVLAASCLLAAPPAEAGPPKPVAASARKKPGARKAGARAPTRRAMRAEKGAQRVREGEKARPAALKPSKKKARAKARPVRARSLGYPNDGRLEGGVRLDLRPSHLHLVGAYAGDVRWGMPELVGAIERAARAVARKYPGASLGVGDLSRRRGGEVRRHGSHESGRDADLAFYAVDRKGKPFRAGRFVAFDGSLRSTTHPGVRFDVAKNWLFLQNLLLDPKARVSHVFVSDPLKYRLLAHAKSRGVSAALLRRASVVMLQPTNALAHDDHFHVRISCPPRAAGCIEVAKNAPSKAKKRIAKKASGKAKKVAKKASAKKASAKKVAKKASAVKRAKAGRAKGARPRASARAAAPPGVAPSAPSPDPGHADEDREAMDVVDDAGVLKITD